MREQGHGQHVVDGVIGKHDALLLRLALHVRFQCSQLRLQQVRRAAGHRGGPLQHARLQGGIDRHRGVAVFTLQNARRFFSDGFVALPGQDVKHRLGADNLRGRGDQRNKAEVLAHAGDFRQHLVEFVGGVLLLQLALEVGEHPARHLGHEDTAVGALQLAFKGVIFPAHLAEVGRDALQLQDIQPGVVLCPGEGGDQRLGGRVAVGGAHGRNRRVHAVDARLDGLQQGHLRHPGGSVAVQVQAHVIALLDFADQFIRRHRGEDTGHVLDGDGVDAGFQQLFG